MSNTALLKVSVLLLLSLVTILLFNCYQRYLAIGPELIRNGDFNAPLTDWHYSNLRATAVPSPGTVMLHSDDPAAPTYVAQTILDVQRFGLLRLACDVKTQNVKPGHERWMAARVVLVSQDRRGLPMYFIPHTLVNRDGTHDWKHYESVFAGNAGAATMSLSLELARATGSLWVRNLSLQPVIEKVFFRRFVDGLTLIWLATGLWVLAPLIRSAIGTSGRLIIVSLGFLIVLGTLIPRSFKDFIGSRLFPSLARFPITLPDVTRFQFFPLLSTPDIYKAGHFVLFALLAAAAFIRKSYPVSQSLMLCYLLLFALTTEVAQLLVAGRSARLGDILIDAAGLGTGLVLLKFMRLALLLHNRRKRLT